MRNDPIQYDDNGNFVFNGDLEVQWMKLHRDIQAEYRSEQWHSFLRGLLYVGGILGLGYAALTGLNFFLY